MNGTVMVWLLLSDGCMPRAGLDHLSGRAAAIMAQVEGSCRTCWTGPLSSELDMPTLSTGKWHPSEGSVVPTCGLRTEFKPGQERKEQQN